MNADQRLSAFISGDFPAISHTAAVFTKRTTLSFGEPSQELGRKDPPEDRNSCKRSCRTSNMRCAC